MKYKDIHNGQIFNKIKIVDKHDTTKTPDERKTKILVRCLVCQEDFYRDYLTLKTVNKGCQSCVRKANGRRLGVEHGATTSKLGKFTRNKFIIESDTVYIEMVGKYAVGEHEYAIIDLEDSDKVIDKGRWYIRKGTTDRKYVTMNLPRVNGRAKMLTLHRFLMNLKEGDGLTVDHINGNSMDNRKINLRVCTMTENIANTKLFKKDGTPKHITKHAKRVNSVEFEFYYNVKFSTSIYGKVERFESKNLPTLKEAMLEYNKMAVEVKGRTARLFNVEEYISERLPEQEKVQEKESQREGKESQASQA